MAYADFKDLARRTASDKVLRDKVFNIAKNPKYDGYQSGLASWFTNFQIKSLQAGVLIRMQIMKNQLKNYTNQLFKKIKKNSLFSI